MISSKIIGVKHMDKITFGKTLKELREKSRLTQLQIGKVLNIDRSTYAYYETGGTWPSPPMMWRLSKLFGVNLLDLFNTEEEDSRPLMLHDSESSDVPPRRRKKKPPMISNTSHIFDLLDDEQQLILYYRLLKPEEKKALLVRIEKMSPTYRRST